MEAGKIGENVIAAARRVELLLMDCDGVLTDGRLYLSAGGEAFKVFHTRDGQGIADWHSAGFHTGIVTGRRSEILDLRAEELGIGILKQGVSDKSAELDAILHSFGLSSAQTAFIGDDIQDLALMRRIGFPAAVADAVPEVLEFAEYVTVRKGGDGAVREVTDLLLRARQIPVDAAV